MILPGLEIKQLLGNFSQLSEEMGPTQNGTGIFSGIMQTVHKAINGKNAGSGQGLEGISLASLSGLKGKKLSGALKKCFLENGISLEDVFANGAALKALRGWLQHAGFDPTRIESLLKDLKAGSGKQGVRLSELFKKLSDLEEEDDPEAMADLSALPYIESILSMFLSDPEMQKAALEGVKLEGKGIDLPRLVLNLKNLVQQLPEKGRSVPDESAQRHIVRLMSRMGMTPENGTMTLERFVSELEAMAAKSSRSSATAGLNRFMDHLQWVKDSRKKGTDQLKVSEKSTVEPFNRLKGSAPDHAIPGSKSAASQEPLVKTGETVGDVKNIAASVEDAAAVTRMSDRFSGPAVKQPVRTLPAYVLNQVSRQIIRSHHNGSKEIRLQLHPPNLGRLQINIDGSGGGIRVNIAAEQQGTQELLLSHAGELKSLLNEQGFRLEKIDVQFEQYFDQSLSYARQEWNKSNNRRQRGAGPREPREVDSTPEELSETTPEGEGILDLVA